MTSAVQALEGISAALVRIRDDPRALLEEVLRAAAGHLRRRLDDDRAARRGAAGSEHAVPRVGPDGDGIEAVRELPPWLGRELAKVRGALDTAPTTGAGWVRVPMTLDGAVLGGLHRATTTRANIVEHADLSVLRILADQAAVAMQTATLYATGADLRLQAQQLYDEIARSSQDLETRTAELERAAAAAARAAPAGAARRRTAPDRARTARQRGPVRAVGGHWRSRCAGPRRPTGTTTAACSG